MGQLSARQLGNILAAADSFIDVLSENEVCSQRIEEMRFSMSKMVQFYAEKHREEVNKRKQTLITQFMQRRGDESEGEDDPQEMAAEEGNENEDVMSTLDFEGFMDEVTDFQQAADSGAVSGEEEEEV